MKPIPDGYHTVTPQLIIPGAARALEFYQKAFGAAELMCVPGPGGKVMHAEIQFGDSHVMLADVCPEMGCRGPQSLGGSAVSLMLYVEDVDALASRAVPASAKVQRPVMDQFYGDRSGTFEDPFGHVWTLATHKQDVAPAELDKRIAALCKGGQ